jgi:hypothetical protein
MTPGRAGKCFLGVMLMYSTVVNAAADIVCPQDRNCPFPFIWDNGKVKEIEEWVDNLNPLK